MFLKYRYIFIKVYYFCMNAHHAMIIAMPRGRVPRNEIISIAVFLLSDFINYTRGNVRSIHLLTKTANWTCFSSSLNFPTNLFLFFPMRDFRGLSYSNLCRSIAWIDFNIHIIEFLASKYVVLFCVLACWTFPYFFWVFTI